MLTPFDACHRPVELQIQRSPTNTVRRYVSSLFNNFEDHNVWSVHCARAQAFVNHVCRAGRPSAAGRRAMFRKLNEKPWIVPELYKTRVLYGTCLWTEFCVKLMNSPSSSSWSAHHRVIIAEVHMMLYLYRHLLGSMSFNTCFRVGGLVMVSHC